jgi:hypothetical protein
MMATAAAYGRVYDGGQQRVVPLAGQPIVFVHEYNYKIDYL